ncbi:MAG: hypothetical protein KDH96_04415 [Candidatus Riesia sp.]|nr:hypothetical protein [Candidatus Riesia sp.]
MSEEKVKTKEELEFERLQVEADSHWSTVGKLSHRIAALKAEVTASLPDKLKDSMQRLEFLDSLKATELMAINSIEMKMEAVAKHNEEDSKRLSDSVQRLEAEVSKLKGEA